MGVTVYPTQKLGTVNMLMYGNRLFEKQSTTRTTTSETDMRTAERTYVRV